MMDFMDAMAIGKANAKRDRDRGGSAVKVYRSAAAQHRTRGGNRGTWEHRLDVAGTHWRSVSVQALEDLGAAARGDEWEGFGL